MAKYANRVANPKTPQTEKAKSNQVKGRAGGYVFSVDDWKRLDRFLILGSDKGSYYATGRQLTMENYDCITRCLKVDPKRTVDTIVEISDKGRAIKNDPAIFALAVCSVHGDKETKTYANKQMPKVARYSTAFFTWVDAVNLLKEGRKGKGLLRAMGRWYTDKDAVKLAYQVCKYPSRSIDGRKWSHADCLRLARISPSKGGKPSRNGRALTIPSDDHATVFHYATHGITDEKTLAKRAKEAESTGKKQESPGISVSQYNELKNGPLKYIWAHEKAKRASSVKEIVKLIEDYALTRESIPPQFKNNIDVQRALLDKMPMTALIRNLGSMTSSGLIKPLANETSIVIDKITNKEALKRSRIHPMTVMMALKTYSNGSGMRTSWAPVPAVKDALEEAFYSSFNYVEPTGKKFLFGIDVSSSMTWHSIGDTHMTPREAAAVVAMTCARTEKNYHLMAFSHELQNLNITAKDSLETVIMKTSNLSFGGTDCSLPMEYATRNKLDVDVFVVLTDCETWAGRSHPFQALKNYRKQANKDAKLAVMAFESNGFSIADPDDAGMMDIAGLDSNVPKVLAEFASGNL